MNIKRVFDAVKRRSRRIYKHGIQYFKKRGAEQSVIFICGAQRSGTNMLFEMFDRLPFTRTYNENNPMAFRKYRIKPFKSIGHLIKGPASVLVFKPLMDSQNALNLLSDFPNSKILWMYRHYENVAFSAAIKWNDAQRHIIREIATAENIQNRWYAQNLSETSIDLAKRYYSEELTEESAGVLKWYFRNQLYFDLGLDKNPNVLLVNYENLLHERKPQISAIEKFLGIKLAQSAYSHIENKGKGTKNPEVINQEIAQFSTELYKKLEQNSKIDE